MRALISVSDKTGVAELARALHQRGIEIVSTGGTATSIGEAGVPVTAIAEVTGFPEMLDGRVKTLHPAIHGGLLARLDNPEHQDQLKGAGITPISILISNLYPFEQTVTSPNVTPSDVVENIDIGGPAMVRAAAKNFDHVFVVTDPSDYDLFLNTLDASADEQQAFRHALAAKAFGHVSTYDSLVSSCLRSDDDLFPNELSIGLRRAMGLRYGENPHQQAAAYHRLVPGAGEVGVLNATQLHGKELSFNNILDTDAALQAVRTIDSPDPTVAVIKHMIPCGLATRSSLDDAFNAAREGDTVSAFGGIVASSHPIDERTAKSMSDTFFEVVIAPGFDPPALEILKKKKNLRLLQVPKHETQPYPVLDIRPVAGGVLVQEQDTRDESDDDWRVVTDRQPTDNELRDMRFAWSAARLVKSNAIVFVADQAIVGVGAGQPNRLESVAIASRKAGDKAKGAAMASDAFFPFADGIEEAASAGIRAVIQPGGSRRDDEVIEAANEADITMIFTGRRHFRH